MTHLNPSQLIDRAVEEEYLAACLLDATVLESGGVSVEHLAILDTRAGLSAMQAVRERGEPVDTVSLQTELVRRGWTLQRAVTWVLPLTDRVPRDPRTLASRIRLMAEARGIAEAAATGQSHAYRLEVDEARERMASVAFAGAGNVEILSEHDLMVAAGEAWHEISQDEARRARGEAPRFLSLRMGRTSTVVQALPGDCITVAAATGVGKSSMAVTVAEELKAENVPSGIISIEDRSSKYGSKLLGHRGRVDTRGFWRGAASEREWEGVARAGAVTAASENLIRFAHVKSATVDDVVATMAKMVRVYGVRFLIVDYLQVITAPGLRGVNRRDSIDYVLARILCTARLLDVPVMVLTQLSRPEKGNPFREPQLGDIKESGTIENSSDAVVMMWITTDDKNDKGYGVVRSKVAKDKLDSRGDRWAMRRGFGQVLEEIEGWVEPSSGEGSL